MDDATRGGRFKAVLGRVAVRFNGKVVAGARAAWWAGGEGYCRKYLAGCVKADEATLADVFASGPADDTAAGATAS